MRYISCPASKGRQSNPKSETSPSGTNATRDSEDTLFCQSQQYGIANRNHVARLAELQGRGALSIATVRCIL